MSERLVFELQAIDRATAPLRQVQAQLDRTTAAVRRTTSEYSRAQAGTRNFGMMAGQVGYQIQDFATQVSNGTSAITAFGQQAPQALSMFGAKGALLGTIIAIGAALLNMSAETQNVTFNFQKFANDIGPLMEPLRAVFSAIGYVVRKVMDVVLFAASRQINSLQYLAAAVGALPAAFRAALDQISMRFRAFGLEVEAASYSARAAMQDLRDFLSGTTEQGMFETGTMADNLREISSNLKSQADAQLRLADGAKGFGETMAEAVMSVKEINLKDYFESAGAAAETAGGQVAAAVNNQIAPAAENMKAIAGTIKDSMTSAFMSMVDGTKSVKDAFKDMARQIIMKLYEVLVVQRIVNGIMGFVGKAFPSLAPYVNTAWNGGGITGGKPVLVGEKGPELIVPSRNSQVIPNHQMSGGGVTVVQNINISTGVQQTVRSEIRSLMPQIAESAKAAVFDAQRRSVNGVGYA